MNNKNSGREYIDSYEDENGSIKNKNYNFDFDIDIDIDEKDECFINNMKKDECFINNMKKDDNEDCEELFKEGFIEGFKEGYEKAKREVLVYMKKNKCCIKCKAKSKVRSINKNK
jgi:flagellar biosynthesis/type III secretory pathway protein FliH